MLTSPKRTLRCTLPLATWLPSGPKGGLLLIPRWVLPLHRLLALLEQVLLSTKRAW